MMTRCFNPKSNSFRLYGAKGISVSEEFKVFDNFLAYIGERPRGTSLDRWPNPAGNYERGNVRWATPTQQGRNRTDNKRITFGGKAQTVAEWGEDLNIPFHRIKQRIKLGWSVERALTT